MIDGDTAVFGVDQESGELRTLAAVAKSKKKQFKLTVMAIDHSEPTLNDTISLKVKKNLYDSKCIHVISPDTS